ESVPSPELAAGSEPDSTLDMPAVDAAPSGELPAAIGRFRVRKKLGEGGMGVVLDCVDADLGRRVAIKLVRAEADVPAYRARLLREAQAMARLEHPNVVRIHEVGSDRGRLFIAMEYVDGVTLTAWLQERRTWREVVDMFAQVGAGLAAVHAVGLVHRDFKPDNVLVGRDGRVAVGDFGLAMSSDEEAPLTAPDAHLTQHGALVGTLRYMAPEQLERKVADARSDQFAFCLALWEALDADPFGDLVAAEDAGKVAEVRRAVIAQGPRRRIAGVPARITKALARGLAVRPADRWPSMTELLHELDPARRRNRIAVASIALGAAAVAVGATWWARTPAADPCANVAAPMAQVWVPGSVPRLEAAFAATKRPNAGDAATRTAAILDRRAAAWTVMRVESCEATSHGDQTADLDARRTRCLDARRAELAALVTALTSAPTPDMVDEAIRAANGLPSIQECSDISALLEREPPKATVRAPVAQLELDVARANTLELLGDKKAIAELPALRQRALDLDWAPALARVDATIGYEAWRRGDGSAAIDPLREAATAAARAKDDELGARVLSLEAEALVDADRAGDAIEVARSSELLAARAGDPAGARAQALEALAIAYAGQSKFDDSDKAYADAAALLEHGSDRLAFASVLNAWANLRFERSDYAGALPLANRALELFRSELGEHDPDYARALQSTANLQFEAHHYAEAKRELDQSLAIKEAVFGPEAPTVALTLNSLANVAGALGDHDLASTQYQRAYDIWAKALGADSAMALMAKYNLGITLKHQHKLKQAIDVLSDVLARRAAAKTPQPQKVANVLDALAGVYEEKGDHVKALDHASRALAIREQVLGPKTGDVAESLAMVAQIEQELGRCAKAAADAKRSIEILKGLPNGEADAGLQYLVLAQCAHGGDARPLYEKVVELLSPDPDA
ncbi:MAG: protein kinase domain-containing protein, partial [Acidobacteriota bacterium]